MEETPVVRRVTARRSAVPAAPAEPVSSFFAPLMIAAAIAAAGMIGSALSRRKRAAEAEITVTAVVVVHRVIEFL